MKYRRYTWTLILAFGFLMAGCKSSQETLQISDKEQDIFKETSEEPVEIANEESNYEIIIIDPGFYSWLKSIAKPEGYYSQNFLETRNQIYVIEWNNRVLQPRRFDSQLYELPIDYDPRIDYGYEVNYKLYNYFIYFQRKYNQRLGPFPPRI